MEKLQYFVVVAMLSMMLLGCGSDQDKIVINYCKSLEAGKLDDAISYLSKDAKLMLESAGGKPLLAESGATFKKHKGIHDIKIIRKEVSGKLAKVEIVYNFNDGSKVSDYFPLVKEDGKWKITR